MALVILTEIHGHMQIETKTGGILYHHSRIPSTCYPYLKPRLPKPPGTLLWLQIANCHFDKILIFDLFSWIRWIARLTCNFCHNKCIVSASVWFRDCWFQRSWRTFSFRLLGLRTFDIMIILYSVKSGRSAVRPVPVGNYKHFYYYYNSSNEVWYTCVGDGWQTFQSTLQDRATGR